jgi:hypothetical protein
MRNPEKREIPLFKRDLPLSSIPLASGSAFRIPPPSGIQERDILMPLYGMPQSGRSGTESEHTTRSVGTRKKPNL